MLNFAKSFIALFARSLDNQLENRTILNERIISALFYELVLTKRALIEKLRKDNQLEPKDSDKVMLSCQEDIYKRIFDSVDYDYAIDVNDLKKGLKIIRNVNRKSRVSFLDDFLKYAFSTMADDEKNIRK
jgi:hypothetical protein